MDERLYATDADMLLGVIGELSDKLKCVMLFGHNPEFADLAQRLSNKAALMPTCAVARVHVRATSWASIGSTKPTEVLLDYPKKV